MAKAAPTLADSDLREDCLVGRLDTFSHTNSIATAQADQLVDRYGHLHSEAIFRNWSPAAIKALGVRRIPSDEGGGA